MAAALAELRQCLAQAPSIATWERLIALLDGWSEPHSRQLGLEYAVAHLDASWDPRLRPRVGSWASDSLGHRLACQPRLRLDSLLGTEVVYCPPGSYLRGSDEDVDQSQYYSDEWPRTPVTISRGLWVGTAPVTQREWNHLFGVNHSERANPRHPVERINWAQATAFCNALSERDGLSPAFQIESEDPSVKPHEERFAADVVFLGLDVEGWRLPTEAEWEYLCKAGMDCQWYGNSLHEIAWFYHNSNYTTHPVREKQPNLWRLFDILGNVFEWCLDTGDTNDSCSEYAKEAQVDPLYLNKDSTHRIVRGGSRDSISKQTRAAFRDHRSQEERSPLQGFRLVRTELSAVGALE